jgi:hypothetical protein
VGRKLDKEKLKKLIDALLTYNKDAPDQFLSIEEICLICGLDPERTTDEKMARAYIQQMRKIIRSMGYEVHNKRNMGWKVAVKFEAIDEREKLCRKTLKYIISAQRSHFNKTLTLIDVVSDDKRKMQHEAVYEFAEILSEMIVLLNKALDKRF